MTRARALAAAVVVVVALTAVGATAARHRPSPPHAPHATVSRVSTLPIIAPWQTGWNEYPIQVYPMAGAINVRDIVAPPGQWWRVQAWAYTVIAGGAGTDRSFELSILTPAPVAQYTFATPQTTDHAAQDKLFAGPFMTPYANLVPTVSWITTLQLPDLIYPPGTTFEIRYQGSGAGDLAGPCTIAVNIYTEERPGVLAPTATPLLP